MINKLKIELELVLDSEVSHIRDSDVWADEIHSIIENVLPVDLDGEERAKVYEELNECACEWFDNY